MTANGQCERLTVDALLKAIDEKHAIVGVVGLGYVGLPLTLAATAGGYRTLGFDIDPAKSQMIQAGKSYFSHISCASIENAVAAGLLSATSDFSRLSEADVILICVPTPLTPNRTPDLAFVVNSVEMIAKHLRPGQLVVLESTTWPGTTEEIVKPILDATGLICGQNYFLAFSPEREDPGNAEFTTHTIPKIVGADDEASRRLAVAIYRNVITTVTPLNSARGAEATKLAENIFRAVNIALVNELKIVFDAMGIDVWEVIDAAKTKPFGFMPFYPGPGLGGHCIPVDPFYLTWKAREYEISTRFIELAGEINGYMPHYVLDKLALALNQRLQKGLKNTSVLVVGIAYKKNLNDTRESPALRIIDLLEQHGAVASYYDPYVPIIPHTRKHSRLAERKSIDFSDTLLGTYSAAVIVTDHDMVDYAALVARMPIVVDTRNVVARAGLTASNVVKA